MTLYILLDPVCLDDNEDNKVVKKKPAKLVRINCYGIEGVACCQGVWPVARGCDMLLVT